VSLMLPWKATLETASVFIFTTFCFISHCIGLRCNSHFVTESGYARNHLCSRS
jgi:hypothetical protein